MFDQLAGRLAHICARHFILVILASILLSGVGMFYTARHLKMDTDVSNLVSSKADWRKRVAQYQQKFPQFVDMLIIVVDATTPDMAREASLQLMEAIRSKPKLFTDVREPGSGEYFERNGLLFLKKEELTKITGQIIKAQPFLASLAADPSLRGLFSTLDLALQAVANKATDPAQIIRPLEQIDLTMANALEGGVVPLSWQNMILDSASDKRSLRHIILTRPYQDFENLEPGEAAIQFIRDKVKELNLGQYGVTVRLTGNVALEAEEFATISEGTGIALIISIILVLVLLFLAFRSWKPILATFLTLIIGLFLTLTFTSVAIGSLNLISIAFAVMFIGLSIDFGIQFGVAYNQQLGLNQDQPFLNTGQVMARPLTLAAFAIALGFLSFLPTDYRGVSELGLIAGAGMIITLILNLTLLPALLSSLKYNHNETEMGYKWAQPVDRFLVNSRKRVLVIWYLIGIAGTFCLTQLQFDFNPLHLKDKRTESVSTLYDLASNKLNSPYPGIVMADSIEKAQSIAAELKKLPEVGTIITANSLVPVDQEEKLPLIEDAAFLLEPSLHPIDVSPAPTMMEIRQVLMRMAERLEHALPDHVVGKSLAAHLLEAAKKEDTFLTKLQDQMLSGFAKQLSLLTKALSAAPVTLDDLPSDIRRDWIAEDGTAIIMALPSGDADDTAILGKFVEAISQVTENTSGPAVQIYYSARAIVDAFIQATLTAIIIISLMLLILLRRIRDSFLVVLPLAVAAAGTALIAYIVHLNLNYANIIALPLLLGIGVAFNVYFVVNWRRGIPDPLQTPTTRAVIFSALTTATSFASLALSAHPGTASMGLLLLIGLMVVLATTLFFLPSLLGKPPSA